MKEEIEINMAIENNERTKREMERRRYYNKGKLDTSRRSKDLRKDLSSSCKSTEMLAGRELARLKQHR